MLDAIEVRLLGDRGTVAGMFGPVEERKAIIHQLGLGRMPQRRFFGLSNRDTQALSVIEQIFTKELGGAIGKV